MEVSATASPSVFLIREIRRTEKSNNDNDNNNNKKQEEDEEEEEEEEEDHSVFCPIVHTGGISYISLLIRFNLYVSSFIKA